MNTNNNLILEWQAPIRPDYERSERWYVAAGSVCATMVAYGVLSGTWSMALVFAFLPALYWLARNQSHKTHTIRLTTLGIEFDGKLTVWGEWKEFWILSGPQYHELHIGPNRKSRPDLVIQTGAADPYLVRDILSQFLPQVTDRHERLLDAFIRFCKI
jgi:hypothetical protein